ncbi:MAG: glycosyltransferase family 2 protein [Chitinophagaceae bacterium]|nr:glycosyltransferase family 2 protein [Chitinophagaceae bacterium]
MLNQNKANAVFVIIPFYNENTVIREVIEDLLPYNYQIVLVNDGSTKSPYNILKDIDSLYFLHHKVNLGQGAAIQTGIDFALQKGAEYLVTFDADGQHLSSDIQSLLEPLQNNEADICIASRFLEKGRHNATKGRKITLKVGRWVNYFFTGLFLSDAHNGLRAMNRTAADKFNLKENRMAHATEFLIAIKKNKIRYKEIPATVVYSDYSRKKGQSVFSSIRIFFDLVLHKLFE